ncbi:hypothetical protein EB796_000972 [Bugula neritina]|uniref:Thyroglobulin type-1 domain-containing protein n=1 Tax=Bugula neritina TaxID=10212 RepID=A0A7J7KRL1_BUGNE|nr:hypothetical protein EB796_000972 [Bugula neritina]
MTCQCRLYYDVQVQVHNMTCKCRCYCVDVHGKLIDGYSHGVSETDDRITCQCARDKSAYFKLGIIGRLFHCTEHGDYENVQCHGSVCYCADRKTGKQIDGTGIHISAKSKLDC